MLWPRAIRRLLPQEFIKAEPPDSLRTPIRKKAMLACTYLVYPFLRRLGGLAGGPLCVSAGPLTRGSAPWSRRWRGRRRRT